MRRWLLCLLGLPAALIACLIAGILAYALWQDRDLPGLWRSFGRDDRPFTVDPDSLDRAAFADPVFVGTLGSPQISEASGLAASSRRDDLLWVLNDGGHPARLYPIALNGSDRGSFVLPEEVHWNEDWEDLTSFVWQGRSYLMIGDVGDNFAWHRTRRLIVVEEPELSQSAADWAAPVEVAWSFEFRYEDGPRDCESIAVDPASERVLLLEKAEPPMTVYELPLRSSGSEPEVARAIAVVDTIPQPTRIDRKMHGFRGDWLSRPTALDVSPDGREAVVLTYKYAYRYTRAEGEAWSTAFARVPEFIIVPPTRQAEAMSFDRTGRSLYVTSEQQPSPLFRIDRVSPHSGQPQ
ncbi:MAG: hypothetical protein GY725_13765 [bacterium]|nr:hypothetical protein [bacterium]